MLHVFLVHRLHCQHDPSVDLCSLALLDAEHNTENVPCRADLNVRDRLYCIKRNFGAQKPRLHNSSREDLFVHCVYHPLRELLHQNCHLSLSSVQKSLQLGFVDLVRLRLWEISRAVPHWDFSVVTGTAHRNDLTNQAIEVLLVLLILKASSVSPNVQHGLPKVRLGIQAHGVLRKCIIAVLELLEKFVACYHEEGRKPVLLNRLFS
mmetsp:Transcript_5274/g.9678  ORF Transcript_5274/g.9678 Transcript_5274/m.9678 type:complete len:207 (+) Transcript_5274:202-822(+)